VKGNNTSRTATAIALTTLLQATAAQADFDSADEARLFGMGLPADALGQANATTANWKGFSSDNPATLTATANKLVYAGTNAVDFSAAPAVSSQWVGVTLPTTAGVFDISVGTTRSKRGISRAGDDFQIDKDPYLIVMYGAEVASGWLNDNDSLSLGVMLAPEFDSTDYSFYDGTTLLLETDSAITAQGFGAQYTLNDSTGIGVSWNRWELETTVHETGVGSYRDDGKMEWWKAAVTHVVNARWTLNTEWRRYEGTSSFTEWAFSTEYCLTAEWCAYAGHSGGTDGGNTFGIGHYRERGFAINLAYADQIADDIDDQFGESPTLSLAIVLPW
jgi:hypothetical protein